MSLQPNPFLTAIISEPMIYQNELFSIVEDKEPITAGHYMVFSNEILPSFADADVRQFSSFLETGFSNVISGEYSYFERGRASFCTSLNGVIHAHGHLLPKFSDELDGLFEGCDVKKHNSLQEAYQALPAASEYLLWGNLSQCFYTVCPLINVPKRIIRTAVAKYLV